MGTSVVNILHIYGTFSMAFMRIAGCAPARQGSFHLPCQRWGTEVQRYCQEPLGVRCHIRDCLGSRLFWLASG